MTVTSGTQHDRKNGAAPVPEQVTAAPDSAYTVGPGRPPKEHQFKKGQSGNRKGAKRKAPSLAPDLKKILEQALERKVTLIQGEKRRTLTVFAAGIERLIKQFVNGDRHARKELFDLANQVGLDLIGGNEKAIAEPTETSDTPAQRDTDLTREEFAVLTDEQLSILRAAMDIQDEILSRRKSAASDSTKDAAA
jgi:hypothetical protein